MNYKLDEGAGAGLRLVVLVSPNVATVTAALMWHLAQIADRAQAVRGPGRLFSPSAT
ncbi:hypothetical protein [Roseovarius amoyensis]|uniref:hypothetical protein n=1 Tax=Roseovarius amoyensis TaxID=2211448 RepID=UPI0013A6D02F|nr:hypothetical protein [Roseovarius amoyensis]